MHVHVHVHVHVRVHYNIAIACNVAKRQARVKSLVPWPHSLHVPRATWGGTCRTCVEAHEPEPDVPATHKPFFFFGTLTFNVERLLVAAQARRRRSNVRSDRLLHRLEVIRS